MMMLIEVHHLETVELVGHCLNLLSFARLDDFHPFGVPVQSRMYQPEIPTWEMDFKELTI
tara:strand:- start:433 stop:612 length:180 start_codon:yes stop_codon:yes gene_type:complete